MPHRKHTPSSSHINLRLERWHRRCVYAVCIWLTLSGVLWLIAHYWLRINGEFGETPSPLEPWAMKLHGAGAMLMLFFSGSLMNSHIRRAFKSRRNLYSGCAMLALTSILIGSGYGLYYLINEHSRIWWSLIHWIVGLLFPALMALHIVLGRTEKKGNSV